MGSLMPLVLLFWALMSPNNAQSRNITYLETIITDAIQSAKAFQHPRDASEYEPPLNQLNHHRDFGKYDFIVIGGGSTGAVLANRLSENADWTVLLLEAGDFGNDVTDIPSLQGPLISSKMNWVYKSIPQKTACLGLPEQKCTYNRGKGIGGTTLFNGLSYTRGSPVDFDKWAQLNPGWSYEEVLPYFKKSENFVRTDPDAVVDYESHGFGGELNVEFRTPRHPQTSRWLRANRERGHKIIDHNGRNSIGATVTQVNKKQGMRQDTGTAFIKPIAHRKNLKISTRSYVTKIVIRSKTVRGVEFVNEGKTYLAGIKKEVILSAGVVGSPQILMLSGIGPAAHLQELGIPVVEDLEVGNTLRDHHMYCNLGFTSNYTRNKQSLTEYVREYLEGVGTLTVPAEKNGMGFYRTKFENRSNYPDFHVTLTAGDGFAGYTSNHKSRDLSMCLVVLHSKSVGTLRLKSSNPFDYPLIDPNLLSDPDNRDIDTLYEGLKMGLDIMNTTAYRETNAALMRSALPACDDKPYLSKDYWYCAFRQSTVGGYHPVGTCPMGPDPKEGAVVDSNCKVYGIQNLRVADASVFPFALSGHPSAVCTMVGEKVADLIKKQY